ncbi:MAG: YtxH domain-containing protein [Bacteroidia bacterium]|nr:MAG: YtxH domain-containing protein [Bacteroidia bacterium]
MSSSNGKVLFGFIFGAAVGVAAGLLFAPSSGEETRHKLKEKGKEYSDELAKQVNTKIDELKQYVSDKTEDARTRIKKAMPEEDKS